MLKLISGVVMALALMFGPFVAKANEQSCMPKAEFMELVKKAQPREIDLLPAHAEKLVAQFANESQMKLNPNFKWTLAAFVLKGGNIGVVLLKNGCYSTSLSFSVDPGMFARWIENAGITDLDWKNS
jgi:hypothetical protein